MLNCCCSGVVSDVEVCKTDAGEAMEVVCKFFYFEAIILTVKKVFLEIS